MDRRGRYGKGHGCRGARGPFCVFVFLQELLAKKPKANRGDRFCTSLLVGIIQTPAAAKAASKRYIPTHTPMQAGAVCTSQAKQTRALPVELNARWAPPTEGRSAPRQPFPSRVGLTAPPRLPRQVSWQWRDLREGASPLRNRSRRRIPCPALPSAWCAAGSGAGAGEVARCEVAAVFAVV